MNKNDILKKIGIIINELQEQYAYSEENADDINDLELELFVANAHFLTDHLEILRKLYNKQVSPLRQELLPPVPEVKAMPFVPLVPEKRYFEPMVQPIVKKEPEPVEPEMPELLLPEETESNELEIIAEPEHEEEVQQELPHIEEELIIPIIRHELIYDEPASELPEEEEHNDAEEGQEEEWIEQELSEMEFIPQEQVAEREHITETFKEAEPVTEEPEYVEESVAEQEQYFIEPEETTSEAEEVAVVISQPAYTAPEPAYEPEAEIMEVESTVEEEDSTEKPLTLNEILAAQRVAEIPQLPPVKDIKSAINLNDKLLYVRDLFNGYSMAYGEAIEILNRFNKFEEADQFLRINYYNKNNWEAKQDTADKFYILLRRRFPD